jgi:RNA polymerase sigma-70 factor (ECF subfamily)
VPDNRSDQELVQRARGGHIDAVSELYRRYVQEIYRYCYFRLHDEATAEDLTADVFVAMVESLPRYVDRGLPFTAWLYRIASARLVDYYRRMTHRQADELSDDLVDHSHDIESDVAQRIDVEQIWKALAELTEEQQLVVQLRFIEGKSVDEVAQQLGKSPGSVKALQHRALGQLSQRLDT